MPDALHQHREEIDQIDDQIIRLLNQRARHAIEIGRIKEAQGEALYVPSRERKVLSRLMASNRGPLSHLSVCRIYKEIMASALASEHHNHVLAGGGPEALVRRCVDFVAGGNTEVSFYTGIPALLEAYDKTNDALMVVTDPWWQSIRRQWGVAHPEVRWLGQWAVDVEKEDSPVLVHVLGRTQAQAGVTGPATCYCALELPSDAGDFPPAWLSALPARSVEVRLLTPESPCVILQIRTDMDAQSFAEQWFDRLREPCIAVWIA